MNRMRFIGFVITLGILLIVVACGGNAVPTAIDGGTQAPPSPSGQIAKNSSSSGPIAISDDDALLVVVNNLNDSITVINVAGDANAKIAEITVGDEPRSVALMPDKTRAYVTNQASATVSVIDMVANQKTQDIPVGVEPYGVAITPDGSRAYVTNSASNTVSVIDTASNTVIATIKIPGVQPRGIAITNNNGGAGQQFVYVTQFLSQPTASGSVNVDRPRSQYHGQPMVLHLEFERRLWLIEQRLYLRCLDRR